MLTEDYSEIKYEPKTGKAEGFDFGIKDFLTGSVTVSRIRLQCSTNTTPSSWQKHNESIPER